MTSIDELASLLFELRDQVQKLGNTAQLTTSTVGDDPDTTVSDVVADAVDVAASLPGLEDQLDANADALDAAAAQVDAAVAAAAEASDAGIAAAELAGEAADEALARAADADAAAADAVLKAADAVQKANDARTAVADVDQRAADADAKAVQAGKDASDAIAQALAAAGIAAGKGTVYTQPDPPVVVDPNGLWFDTDDGNKPYRGVNLGIATRTNLVPDPTGRALADWSNRWFGNTGGSGTYTPITGAADGPTSALTSYMRKTWTQDSPEGGNGNVGFQATPLVPATPGKVYTFSGWIRMSLSGLHDVRAKLYWATSDGSFQAPNGDSHLSVAGEWLLLSVTATAPDGATGVFGILDVDSNDSVIPAGSHFEATGALLEVAPAVGPWFDGDTFGCSWSGTPNASASTYPGPGWIAVPDASIAAAAQAARDASHAADTAQTTADGKNSVTYSPNAPTTDVPGKQTGDQWFQRSSSTGVVAGFYEWTSAGNWKARTLDNAVLANLDAGKITAGYLDAARIKVGSLTGDLIAAATIKTANLAAGAITTEILAASSITAAKVAADTLTAREIAADAITAAELAADAVVARNIKAGEVTAGKIAADAVAAGNIQAGAVVAGKIAAGAVTAEKLAVGAVVAGTVAAGAIDGITITGATFRTASAGRRTETTTVGLSFFNQVDTIAGRMIPDTDNTRVIIGLPKADNPGSTTDYTLVVGPKASSLTPATSVGVASTSDAAFPNVFVNTITSLSTGTVVVEDTGWKSLSNSLGTIYYRRLNGFVVLRGTTAPTANNQTQFTLPAGFRIAATYTAQIDRSGTAVRVRIGSDGTFLFYSGGSSDLNWAGISPYPADN
jgi:hypothetical protein